MYEDKNIRLCIIDDNTEDCEIFQRYFSDCKDLKVCSISSNGADGIENVKKYKPDVVLTDFIMPNIDGSGVVKQIKDIFHENIKVIVLSGISDTKMINEAFKYGADYYLMKPINLNFLRDKIISLFRLDENHKEKCFKKLNEHIKDLGIPLELSGYDYALDALDIMMKSERTIMLKEISSSIAQKNCTSTQCVDACLHNAINKAHERKTENYKKLFGDTNRCPSNYVFLRTVREYIRNKK